jgi:hypothetical protein
MTGYPRHAGDLAREYRHGRMAATGFGGEGIWDVDESHGRLAAAVVGGYDLGGCRVTVLCVPGSSMGVSEGDELARLPPRHARL